MELHMSENEIVRNYREARDKKTQILILADLNCCSKDTILDVLERNGERVGWFRPKSEEQKEKIRNTRLRANSDDLDKIIEEAHEVEIEVENEPETEFKPSSAAESSSVTEPIPTTVPSAIIETLMNAIELKRKNLSELTAQIVALTDEIESIVEWIKKVEVD